MIRAIGLDHGDARIGVAISDELGMLAHPVETIIVKETDPLARIARLAVEKNATQIIIGLPKNMDGTTGPAAEKVRTFAEKLRTHVQCPIHLWDERLSTVAAQKSLHAVGKNTRQSRAVIDQAAAQIILQSWLDSQSFTAL